MGGSSNLNIYIENIDCNEEEWKECIEKFENEYKDEWFEEGDNVDYDDKYYNITEENVWKGYNFGDSGIERLTKEYKIKVEVNHTGEFTPYSIHYENGVETYDSREMERKREREYEIMKKIIYGDEKLRKRFEELMK